MKRVKLTDEQVRELRREWFVAEHGTRKALVGKYGFKMPHDYRVAYRIAMGETYAHVL